MDAAGDDRIARLRAELAASRRRIEDLETLGDTVALLDPELDPVRLLGLGLQLALRVLRGDVALLVARTGGRETTHVLVAGDAEVRELSRNPSRLVQEVLATGRGGARRETGTPGARAAAELLGGEPAVRVATPLRRGDRILGALEVGFRAEPEGGVPGESAALRSVGDHLAIALETGRLVREHGRRVRELEMLFDIGTKISAHLDLDELLDDIVDSFLELVPADAAGIFLIEEETRAIRNEKLRGYEGSDLDHVRLKVGKGILGWVASTGEGVIVPDVSRDPRYVAGREATRSEMAAPVEAEGRVIGIFNLESDRLDAFHPRDLELLQSFSNHAAISITNARLHAEAREMRRLEEQLEVARDIQTRLLPREAPRVPGHVLAGRAIPSSAVGGDWFDFVPVPGGRWAVVIADVSGHGVPAGLIMAGFRAEVRAGLRRSDDPRAILGEANAVLAEELEIDRFVTAFLGVYAPEDGTLTYCNAGHEPGLLVRAGGGVEFLSDGGLLLGVFPEAEYRSATVRLGAGDRLLLYTDGLSDAGDPWGDLLGTAGVLRLAAAIREDGVPPEAAPAEILDRAVRDAAVPPDEADDRTLVLLERLGAADGAPDGSGAEFSETS